MNMTVLLSHDLTPGQIAAADAELGVAADRIVLMPAELRARWMSVPPDGPLDPELVAAMMAFVLHHTRRGDPVLVQGEPGLQTAVVLASQRAGRVPVYSTTQRESVEVVGPDGAVNKQSRFVHVQFREYPVCDR